MPFRGNHIDPSACPIYVGYLILFAVVLARNAGGKALNRAPITMSYLPCNPWALVTRCTEILKYISHN